VSTIEISADRARMDIDAIRAFLARSYWAEEIPREIVARARSLTRCVSAPSTIPRRSGSYASSLTAQRSHTSPTCTFSKNIAGAEFRRR